MCDHKILCQFGHKCFALREKSVAAFAAPLFSVSEPGPETQRVIAP